MSCSCGSKSTKSCKCKDKKYTSGITYDGEQLVCNQGGISRFTINPCSDLNNVIQILSEKICELYGIGTINANSVWVDTVYGNDETGEYGNIGKPFKTIIAGQIAAYNYMNANPNLYDMSSTTYKVTPFVEPIEIVDTNIVPIEAPRVRIHVAPGVYYAFDEWQYIIDNPDLFNGVEGDFIQLYQLNNSFNLMMPYVDYELDAGATLIDYGFNVYFTIPEIVDGYSPYYYNTEPPDNGMLTRVFGNGTLFCSKTVAPYFAFGLPLGVYLEPNCVLEIECEQHNLLGYFYGGTFKSRTKTYIVSTTSTTDGEYQIFGSIIGLYFDQEEAMPNDPTSSKHEIISENIIFEWGNKENLLAVSGNTTLYNTNFIFASKSYDLVCNNYVGRNVVQNYLDGQFAPLYSRDRDNVATPQWIYNYFSTFSANEAAPFIWNGNYYDDSEMIVNIDIKYAKFGFAGFYCENNGDGVAANQRITTNINIPVVDLEYWYQIQGGIEGGFFDAANFFISGYGDENNLINCPNTRLTVRSANNSQIDAFYGGGVDNFATILAYGEITDGFRFFGKIRTRLLGSVASINEDRMNSFLKAGFSALGISENIALDNCIFYSENNTNKDNFFGSTFPGAAITDYNVKLFSNCYTNTIDIWDDGIGGPINVINTIPETKLIVSDNVKI